MRTPTWTVTKGCAISIERDDDIEDAGSAVNLPEELDGAGIAELLVVGADGEGLVFVVRIGAEEGDGLAVADVDVVDSE